MTSENSGSPQVGSSLVKSLKKILEETLGHGLGHFLGHLLVGGAVSSGVLYFTVIHADRVQIANVTEENKMLETSLEELKHENETLKQQRAMVNQKIANNMFREGTKKTEDDAEAQSKETADLLAPFFTRSLAKPEVKTFGGFRGRTYRVREGTTEAPMSYSLIMKAKALEQTDLGLRELVNLAAIQGDGRPDWPAPHTAQDWDRVRKAQDLLRRLGPNCVSLGLLAE